MNAGAETALAYHWATAHEPGRLRAGRDDRLVRGYQPMRPEVKPPQVKAYGDRPARPVPAEWSEVLFLSAGVVRYYDHPVLGRMYFRAAGSAGNLHPLELYVVEGDEVSHYDPVAHALVPIGHCTGETDRALVVTGVPWRTGWKYTERGWRHLYWDCGTMLSQTLAVAPNARIWLGFVDDDIAAVVGADGVHEFPLVIVTFGPDPPDLRPGDGTARGHLADHPVEFPFVTAVQHAGDLDSSQAVKEWRSAASPAKAQPLPIDDVAAVIRRRGSTRAFDRSASAPPELLAGAFRAAAAPVPGDFVASGATLLEHFVSVHAVEEREPGRYRWTGDEFDLVAPGDVRDATGELALGQDLAADSCYTAFHCSDIESVTTDLGARGLRAPLLEAGIVEGRLHLMAFAAGFGATGLTFFDRAVMEFFGTGAAPMLETAVGRPLTRAPVAGQPGRPVPLSR